MPVSADQITEGLSTAEVLVSRQRHGRNEVSVKKHSIFSQVVDVIKDPMVILLLVAACLYFISGETGDGIFMTIAIFLVTGISWYQESRSRNALAALKNMTAPTCKVVRNGETVEILREDIVIGDHMVLAEGASVPADGRILHSNDFFVNQSILTGESLPVAKNANADSKVFQGTTVTGGLAVCEVTAIAAETELGKIAESLETVQKEESPLQQQVRNFVKKMALVGVIIFLLVWVINFFQSRDVLDSLLKALTLAMSILPEEIPVAFTTFMALGAWRLARLGVIVKRIKTVETLGSATVICVDKTGTITENRMTLAKVYAHSSGKTVPPDDAGDDEKALIRMAMWASEPIPFDPMETALHEAYSATSVVDERQTFRMIHEYPLGGRPPMMTHIFENKEGEVIIAAKGAPEAMLRVSNIPEEEKSGIYRALEALTAEGFRVLGVGEAAFSGKDFPEKQQDLSFYFLGLVAFYDPPKKNIREVFQAFYDAGIVVKIITGDNSATTATIARELNFRGADTYLTGEELLQLSDREVREKAKSINVFTRMFPDAKLRILNALKDNGEIVAMTGDGVNDGPALKGAHIGIAMGKRGTETAKEVASLIITDDDLSKMVDAVAMGRRIYANLKKAIQYIISIHIPIILTVFIPLVMGWVYPAIFSPVHVIFLELIMGPTCSIIYENEPPEKNIMVSKPRLFTNTFFNFRELVTSIIQGLAITAGTLFVYQHAVGQLYNEDLTRTMVFATLISANVFLTLVNRSFYYSLFATLSYRNNLVPLIIAITVLLLAAVVTIPVLKNLFEFETLRLEQIAVASFVGGVSVLWFEGYKWFIRNRK